MGVLEGKAVVVTGGASGIGRAAAGLVRDGETVFLGSGTTVLEAARSLRDRKDLTVITNSLPVANLFASSGRSEVVVTGGVLGSHYSDIFAFIVLILVLVFRPGGLFGHRVLG